MSKEAKVSLCLSKVNKDISCLEKGFHRGSFWEYMSCPSISREVLLGEPGQKFSIFSLSLHFSPLLFIEGFHEKLWLLFCQILPSGIASIISKKFVISYCTLALPDCNTN